MSEHITKRRILHEEKSFGSIAGSKHDGNPWTCGSSDSGKQTDAKTDDSSSTETTDSGEASADSSDGSFDGVKIEVDIEDSIQGDQNTLDCFNKLIDEFSQQTGAEVEVVQNGSDHENIMKTRMASQDMPDMVW